MFFNTDAAHDREGKRFVGRQGGRYEGVATWGRRAVLRAAVLGPLAAVACAAPPAWLSGLSLAPDGSGCRALGCGGTGGVPVRGRPADR